MLTEQLILIYLAVINVATFIMYGIDKWKSKRSKWRIREAALLGLAVLGGSIGAWLGMKVWHHKTMHKKFKYGIPLILVAQIVIILLTACKNKQAVESSVPILERQFDQEYSCVPSVANDLAKPACMETDHPRRGGLRG